MAISKEFMQEIENRLDIVSAAGRSTLEQILANAPLNFSVDEMVEYLNVYYPAIVKASSDNASVVGLDVYNAQRKSQIGSTLKVDSVESNYNDVIVQGLIEDVSIKASASNDISIVGDMLGQYIDSMVMHSYANSQIEASFKDSNRPKFARVPEGNACKFCMMLASRGFVYVTKESAGAFNKYHSYCRCRIVPQFDVKGMPVQVDGYDPDKLYEKYKAGEFGDFKRKGTVRNLNYKTTHKPKIERPVKIDPKPAKLPDKAYGGKWNQKEDMKQFLQSVFEPDDCVGIVTQFFDKAGRRVPTRGFFQRTSSAIERILEKTNNVANAVGRYRKADGVLVRINPLDGKGITDANVKAFKYALIEADVGSMEEQYGFIKALNLPTKAVVTSGNKSVHALVRIDASNIEEYKERVALLHAECQAAGYKVDGATKNPSRLMRLPGVNRGDGRQILVSTDEGAGSWNEWRKWCDANRMPAYKDTGAAIVMPNGQKIPYGNKAGFSGMSREQAIEQAEKYKGGKDII